MFRTARQTCGNPYFAMISYTKAKAKSTDFSKLFSCFASAVFFIRKKLQRTPKSEIYIFTICMGCDKLYLVKIGILPKKCLSKSLE